MDPNFLYNEYGETEFGQFLSAEISLVLVLFALSSLQLSIMISNFSNCAIIKFSYIINNKYSLFGTVKCCSIYVTERAFGK